MGYKRKHTIQVKTVSTQLLLWHALFIKGIYCVSKYYTLGVRGHTGNRATGRIWGWTVLSSNTWRRLGHTCTASFHTCPPNHLKTHTQMPRFSEDWGVCNVSHERAQLYSSFCLLGLHLLPFLWRWETRFWSLRTHFTSEATHCLCYLTT